MSVSRQLPDYPILLSGVAAPVAKGLREMGLPVTELHDDLAQLSGYQSSSWNLLLVGSQKTFNERDLQLLSHCRIPLVDLAEFTSQKAEARTRDELNQKSTFGIEQFNAAFVIRLKDKLQQTGGTWMRLSDYPYPYQGVICYGEAIPGEDFREFSNVMSPLPVPLEQLHLHAEADWEARSNTETARQLRVDLISSYRQGLPVSLTSINSRNEFQTLLQNIKLDRKQFPLVWVTSLSTFFRWWNLRRELSVSINRRNAGWETIISGQFEGFHPGLQIWKGKHSATVALTRGVNEIRDELLALAMNQERHPGGFTAHWAGSKSSVYPIGWKKTAASAAS
ncbi:hypothetical protein [Gimesia panareensis]|uniref:Uncharacterized protein n=1 Tax=Gimesia panareensis TaxID=2527978 RepID=A0A518ADU6_9PLAN|nr:hypothetical protein [Gimesia panareensis]QDT29712.1 hypothetical protein Enr10x_50670 [Gimesia panareensis]QDU52897.1 hypothetical protein Pan110_52790 [Gimesia panareensis]